MRHIKCVLFLVLLPVIIIHTTSGQIKNAFFRKDYVFLEQSQSFYKIHRIHRTWQDAQKRCALEGASLFYGEDKTEIDAVLQHWKLSQPFAWIFVGISDLLSEGDFETHDGKSINDVYNVWLSGEPNDAQGGEDCVTLHRDGTLNDDRCSTKFPFICKKTYASLEWNFLCNMHDLTYVYDGDLGKCYKFHLNPMTWTDAYSICSAELSYLAIPNSEQESAHLKKIIDEAPEDIIQGNDISGIAHLGFHNRDGEGWRTIKGVALADSGFSTWGGGQPDGASRNETCGSMFYSGHLNDVGCQVKSFFICEHDIGGQIKNAFFRKDYVFLEESQSFYKIHKIQRTWQDAKKQCALEGASLFYGEDKTEIDAVLQHWKLSQPFAWVFVGISDLMSKGDFETHDGKLITDVYNIWGPGEPNDANDGEDCVTLHRDGALNDERCSTKFPFICKKTYASLEWNILCDMADLTYLYDGDLGKCYKFHLNPMTWTDAYSICSAELSYLAILNSKQESYHLKKIIDEAPKNNIQGNDINGIAHLGFHNRDGEGWRTIKGVPLADSGFSTWSAGQPDGASRNETCGSMLYSGHLNDVGCQVKSFFICEHDIGLPSSVVDVNKIVDFHRVAKINPESKRPQSIGVNYVTSRERHNFLAISKSNNKKHVNDKLHTLHLGATGGKKAIYKDENLSPCNKKLHAAAKAVG